MEELLGGGDESLDRYLLVMPGVEGAVQRAE